MPVITIEALQEWLSELPKGFMARLPEALESGAEVAAQAMRDEIVQQGLVDTKQLHDSIRPGPVRVKSGERYIEVWPQGRRKREFSKRVDGKRGHMEGEQQTNAEVGRLLEYGSNITTASGKPIDAHHWMENAVTDAESEIFDAMGEVLIGEFRFE